MMPMITPKLGYLGQPQKEIVTWHGGDASSSSSAPAATDGEPRMFHVAAPIVLGSEIIGGVRIGYSVNAFLADINRAQAEFSEISESGTKKLWITAGVVMIFLIVCGVLMADQLGRWLARPIEAIALATQKIGKREYDVSVPMERSDEIGDLAVAVDQMAQSLAGSEKSIREQHIELQKRQNELMQMKKVESLGSMTAGIGHNLNNFLQPVWMLSESLLNSSPDGSNERKILEKIIDSTNSARDLLRHLMAYSRQEVVEKHAHSSYAVVDRTLSIVAPTIPATIRFHRYLDADAGDVTMNEGQIRTVVMNLISNAIDAMRGDNGDLTVTLSRFEPVADAPGPSRPCVRLAVADTGSGMSSETTERMFDPFFTTKSVGEGTGLGLSTAYGIVADHQGTIRCSSAPGEGTTFEILLPLTGDGPINE